MPSLETTVTILIVGAAVLALWHILSNARAGVVLAHMNRYEEAAKSASEPEPKPVEKPTAEPFLVG